MVDEGLIPGLDMGVSRTSLGLRRFLQVLRLPLPPKTCQVCPHWGHDQLHRLKINLPSDKVIFVEQFVFFDFFQSLTPVKWNALHLFCRLWYRKLRSLIQLCWAHVLIHFTCSHQQCRSPLATSFKFIFILESWGISSTTRLRRRGENGTGGRLSWSRRCGWHGNRSSMRGKKWQMGGLWSNEHRELAINLLGC